MRCSFILICVKCWYIINTLYLLAEVEWANHDSPGTAVSSTNKTEHHDKTELLLRVVFNTIDHKHKNLFRFPYLYENNLKFLICFVTDEQNTTETIVAVVRIGVSM